VAKKKPRPTLSLVPGPAITAEDLVELFRHLTGREPTAEERAEARAVLERAAGKRPSARRRRRKPTSDARYPHATPGKACEK